MMVSKGEQPTSNLADMCIEVENQKYLLQGKHLNDVKLAPMMGEMF